MSRFEMRMDIETLELIEGWRREQASIPSRAEAIRKLIRAGITANSDRKEAV
jgi:hypothetical protein